jgi:hypothetical protein
MRKRRADRDADSVGRFRRAWRWLRSSGFYEDDQAEPGPARDRQARRRFGEAIRTQTSFWRFGP